MNKLSYGSTRTKSLLKAYYNLAVKSNEFKVTSKV